MSEEMKWVLVTAHTRHTPEVAWTFADATFVPLHFLAHFFFQLLHKKTLFLRGLQVICGS